eukprot:TRINITY_DN37665_c0_g1_i1.p1 TRINITY_DN37665_c0_g1~~TRINITY_DN37665_c0_g1_i1.p1  ORF type:complete len:1008 (-),score=145.47 TRINITY_DN37665_c0_g1_i1:51-3074(-)
MQSNDALLGNIRLLASDLDGTLLDPSHNPAEGTFQAISAYQAAGGTFAVCTGRDLGSARGVLKGLDIDTMPGVYLNGTVVLGKNGKCLKSATLPRELVLKLVEWGRSHRDVASILFVVGDVHYVMDKSEEYALFMHTHLLDPEPLEIVGGYGCPESAIPDNVNMMRVICSPENMAIVKPQVAECVSGLAAYAQSLPTTIDVMAPRTNKATGLQTLLAALELSESKCCAIGDSENDLEMLQSVRVGCAMGNDVTTVKAVAHFVLPRNRDSPAGVVHLLRSLTKALNSTKVPLPVSITPKVRVACFCTGSWGSAVARLVGQSLLQFTQFEQDLRIWISDQEEWEGQKLVDVINSTRFDGKNLPGLRLPRNLTASSDAKAVAQDADIIVLVVPRGDISSLMDKIAGHVKKSATAVVMSKLLAFDQVPKSRIYFGSQLVRQKLSINSAVLMGGTLAVDVANGYFAEATLGCEDDQMSETLLTLFSRPNFAVKRLNCVASVELFAVLKSIISLASGLCDGLSLGSNTKAAIIRIGAVELSEFAARFYPEHPVDALNEACGWTDIIASSFGDSRSRRCAKAFVESPSKSWEELASECLRSGMPSGLEVLLDTWAFIRSQRAEMCFPFISKIHSIVTRGAAASTLTDFAAPRVRSSAARKVAILGSGNWGTAVARLIASNVERKPEFHKVVEMWVHEELIDGEQLTDIINTRHENPKYLPGVNLPDNLVASSDVAKVVEGANILVFVVPHQYLPSLLGSIKGKVSSEAVAVSLIKGYLDFDKEKTTVRTATQVIQEQLGISCAVLNGANVASDVAEGHFAETTLGCVPEETALILSRLFNTTKFCVRISPDVLGVELFGGLKNVIALAAGFCDGLGLPASTKAAVLRRGLLEMAALVHELFPSSRSETLTESCGVADLLTSCYGGRNRLCAEAFAKDTTRTWQELEAELLNGQKLQGPSTCADVQAIINQRGLQKKFPLFTAIHAAVTKAMPPEDVFSCNGFVRSRPQLDSDDS